METAKVSSSTANSRVVLNGWKEIARYLARGVRTAQRWEEQFGLPIRRPAMHLRSAVVAFSDELDSWFEKRGAPDRWTLSQAGDNEALVASLEKRKLELIEELARLEQQLNKVRAESSRPILPPTSAPEMPHAPGSRSS